MALPARNRQRLLSFLSPLGLLVLWELLVLLGVLDGRFFPPPSKILVKFYALTASGELIRHTLASLLRILAGLVVGTLPAILIGTMMGLSRWVQTVLDPIIAAVYPIPKIAVLPLVMLFFGFGETSKVAVIAIAVFFPVIINTFVGVANIDRIYLVRVVFPGSIPMVFAGIRLAVGIAFIVIVAAEFVAAKSGLGYMIWSSWEFMQVDRMFVGLIVIGALGVLSTQLLRELERWLIPWKP